MQSLQQVVSFLSSVFPFATPITKKLVGTVRVPGPGVVILIESLFEAFRMGEILS
jgi:uncharacterized protein YlxW (UPF0749 family)